MPKVTVIIPTYNRACSIARALESVLRQTFKNIEIIVCDDASTDSTWDIVRGYQAKDPRIQLLRLFENQGAGAARNIGMKAARGEYIAFLDSDDEWAPEKLARQVECMDAQPPEVGVCFCGAMIIKNGETVRPMAYVPNKAWEHDTFRLYVAGLIMFLTPTIMFRRSCLNKSGLMVTEMRRNQDAEFLLRLFSHFGLSVIIESYSIIHLVVSSKNKHYDALKVAMPYHLRHCKMIRDRLGCWPAKYYLIRQQTNLLQAAIRERDWLEAWGVFKLRLLSFPVFFPREVVIILKAVFSLRLR